jgi:hypothetical protein
MKGDKELGVLSFPLLSFARFLYLTQITMAWFCVSEPICHAQNRDSGCYIRLLIIVGKD